MQLTLQGILGIWRVGLLRLDRPHVEQRETWLIRVIRDRLRPKLIRDTSLRLRRVGIMGYNKVGLPLCPQWRYRRRQHYHYHHLREDSTNSPVCPTTTHRGPSAATVSRPVLAHAGASARRPLGRQSPQTRAATIDPGRP